MKRVLVLLPLVVLGAVPASAGTQTDPCGDGKPIVQAGPVVQAAPGARAAGFDLRALEVRDLLDGDTPAGVVVTLTLCGDVPPAELPSSAWQVGYDLPALPLGGDECSGGLLLNDRLRQSDGAVVRTASIGKRCNRVGQPPVFNGVSSTNYEAYSVDLPADAWTVRGNTIQWTLRRSDDLGPAAEQVRSGLDLVAPAARSRDGRMLTQFDTEGVRLTGPGTEDTLPAGPDHTIG